MLGEGGRRGGRRGGLELELVSGWEGQGGGWLCGGVQSWICQVYFRDPKPDIQNPKPTPQTPQPKPETPNPKILLHVKP